MTTQIEAYRLMNFVRELYDIHCLHQVDMERCQRWMDAVVLPPRPDFQMKPTLDCAETALGMLMEVRNFYRGIDMCEDAVAIADIVCSSDMEGEDEAQAILMHLGYLTGLMADWKLTPETLVKLKQIRSIAHPDLYPPE